MFFILLSLSSCERFESFLFNRLENRIFIEVTFSRSFCSQVLKLGLLYLKLSDFRILVLFLFYMEIWDPGIFLISFSGIIQLNMGNKIKNQEVT